MNISICGIDCDACNHKTENKCEGCRISAAKGQCVWGGSCDLYECAASKQLLHCGFCDDFPCEKLKAALDGSVPDEIIIEMIEHSYKTVVGKLPKYIQKELYGL